MLISIFSGPGDYEVIESPIKKSFNKKLFQPVLIDKNYSNSEKLSRPPMPRKPESERPSFSKSTTIRNKLNELGVCEGHIIYEQRKVAFKILRDLVNRNTKQLKILNALQKVELLKVHLLAIK